MKQLSKLAKFFIICAAVFVIGIACTAAGAASGGVQGFEKLAERYDWINSPGERGVTAQNVGDFHSIEATGDVDLWIVGKSYYEKAGWLADQDLLKQTELDVIGSGQVCVIAGDQMEQPQISVEKGVLTIDAGAIDLTGINLNITEAEFYPEVLVCMPDETLRTLTVSGQTVTAVGNGSARLKIFVSGHEKWSNISFDVTVCAAVTSFSVPDTLFVPVNGSVYAYITDLTPADADNNFL